MQIAEWGSKMRDVNARWPPSFILIPGNSHKFVPWPVSTRRHFPFYLFYASHCRRKMGHRLALERELTRSLACLSPPSPVQPYPIARSQTYCANVWHSRYARIPLLLDTRGSRWYTYVQSRRYVHGLEKERSLLRERWIALSGLLPYSPFHGRYSYLWHYMALYAYYILDGGETFQVTFKLHIILPGCNLVDAIMSRTQDEHSRFL